MSKNYFGRFLGSVAGALGLREQRPVLEYRAEALQLRDDAEAKDGERSKKIVAATENPVAMYDWERGEVIPEVLLMSGVEVGDRVPLLDSHGRWSNDGVIGSAVGLKAAGSELHGRALFSKTAEDTWTKVQEGHLRDLSVGYRVLERTYVGRNETAVIGGKRFTGPVNVATRWRVHEVSVTPIGADEQAKMRGLSAAPSEFPVSSWEGTPVNPELRAQLIAAGMPAATSDADAWRWLNDNQGQIRLAVAPPAAPPVVPPTPPAPEPTRTQLPGGQAPLNPTELVAWLDNRDRENRARAAHIRGECKRFGLPAEFAQELCDTAATTADADRKILDKIAERQQQAASGTAPAWAFDGQLSAGHGSIDKGMGVVRAAIESRAVDGALSLLNIRSQDVETVRARHFKPDQAVAAGWEQHRYSSLFDLARLSLEVLGVRTQGMARPQLAMTAFGCNNFLPVGTRAETGFHTTGMFPAIMADAINKSMLIPYREREYTWRRVFRQAASVPDFKQINRNRLSEAANLILWPENTKPNQVAFKDEKESYAVSAYANESSFGWQSLVNDDMDALTRIPGAMGAGARRTQNTLVWAIVTANPTLQDGQALFLSAAAGNRKKANTGTGVVSVANIGAGRKTMRLQVGVNTVGGAASPAILDLVPAFLVVPAALETTAEQLIRSTYDPASSTFMVNNPFTSLEMVVEPLLDDSSSLVWYMFARTSDVDTIELSFLQGMEEPVVTSRVDQQTWALTYQVAQAFGAKAMDFRGCYRSTGA